MSAPVPRSGEVVPARGLRHAFRALRHRDFALFWSGALASNVGTWMQQVTVPFVLFRLTGSAGWIGFAAFLQFLPMMAMNSVGGVLADRWPRKRLIMVTQAGQMIVAFSLWAVWTTGNARPGLLVAIVAVAGTIAGIQIPAWQSFVPQLVPRDSLLNAVTLNSAQFNAARALGPALGGLVLAGWGPGAAFFLNGASYVFVLASLAFVRAAQPAVAQKAGRVGGAFRDGVRYVRAHRGLALAVGIVGFAGVFGAPIVQLTPVFADEVYGVGEAAYGMLTAAMGLGAVLGAVLIGAYGDGFRRSRLAATGTLGFGLTALAMALSNAYWMGLVALFVMGGGYILIASSLNTSIQLMVAEEMRGRVVAIYMMAFTGGFPVGALLLGRLTDTIGVQATVGVAGGVLAALGCSLFARTGRVAALDAESLDPVESGVAVAAVAPAGS